MMKVFLTKKSQTISTRKHLSDRSILLPESRLGFPEATEGPEESEIRLSSSDWTNEVLFDDRQLRFGGSNDGAICY